MIWEVQEWSHAINITNIPLSDLAPLSEMVFLFLDYLKAMYQAMPNSLVSFKANKDPKGDPESPSIISTCCTARMIPGLSALPSVKKNGDRKAEPTSKSLPNIGGKAIQLGIAN